MILADPVDTILRRLSVAYLDEAASVAKAELEGFLGQTVDLEPVFFHPAKNNWFPDLGPTISDQVLYYDRWGPFGGVGWLAHGVEETALLHSDDPEILPKKGRTLCLRLLDSTPRLSLGGGGRWSSGTTAPMDSETQLAAFLADNETFPTAWNLESYSIVGPPETPWQRAREAANRTDASELLSAMADAHHRYSQAGHRALNAGVLNLLARRLAGQQAESAHG